MDHYSSFIFEKKKKDNIDQISLYIEYDQKEEKANEEEDIKIIILDIF